MKTQTLIKRTLGNLYKAMKMIEQAHELLDQLTQLKILDKSEMPVVKKKSAKKKSS